MALTTKRVLRRAILALLIVPLAGCGVVADMINPRLPIALGLDLAPILPSQGVVIVAFRNSTRFPATFRAYHLAGSASAPSASSRNFEVEVDGGKVGNEVLDCPVEIIGPGVLDSSFVVDATAAVRLEVDATNPITVPFVGQAVQSGRGFVCGDVIEIRVATTTGGGLGAESGYIVTVRVIPGG